jgi:hypothetical protein
LPYLPGIILPAEQGSGRKNSEKEDVVENSVASATPIAARQISMGACGVHALNSSR